MSLKLCKVTKYKDGKIVSSEYVDAFKHSYDNPIGVNTKEARKNEWQNHMRRKHINKHHKNTNNNKFFGKGDGR